MSSTAHHHTFSRRSFLQTAAASGIALGAGAVLGSAATELAPQPIGLSPRAFTETAAQRPFDPTHPVYQPIPTEYKVYGNSGKIVEKIRTDRYRGIRFDCNQNSPNVYVGTANHRRYILAVGEGGQVRQQFEVHAPAGMKIHENSQDLPLVVLDSTTMLEYRAFQAVVTEPIMGMPGMIAARYAGVGRYDNDGTILNADQVQADGMVMRALGQAEFWGQNTGSGCSYTVGMIRPIDVINKKIDHAIRVAIGYPHPSEFFWPALRTEIWNTWEDPDSLCPMGARIFLHPDVDIDTLVSSLNVSRHGLDDKNVEFARMVLTAMKEYGLIALDGAGNQDNPGKSVIYMEGIDSANWVELIGGVNPFGSYNHIGRAIDQVLPWDKLLVADESVFDGYARKPEKGAAA